MTGDPFFDDDLPLRPSDAAAAILIAPDGKYLLQLRDVKFGIYYPGHWGCFGGALEASDSSIEEGLRRELEEELELTLAPGALNYFTNMTFDMGYAGLGVMGRAYYEARLNEVQLSGLRLGEGSAFRSFTLREALSGLPMVPYDSFALWQHANRNRILPPNS